MSALAFLLRTVQRSKFQYEIQYPSAEIQKEDKKLPKLV